jgi:hypothetical protein
MTPVRADVVDRVQSLVAPHGLVLRGGFNFRDREDVPAGLSGAPAKAVLLIGNVGADYWPAFEAWRAGQTPNLPNPLDTWCRAIIGSVAARIGARAVSPSDKPYLPFQQWAMRAEGLRPSPLGILMHPIYGLWHAYRGALLFDAEIVSQEPDAVSHPCDLCVEQPCRIACPVGAHAQAFAYADCLSHVRSVAGAPCQNGGCLDRNACPIGIPFRYPAPVQAFHMAAFAR